MAPRATWKGALAIGLVRIPVKVFPATESADAIGFNQLHEACSCRVTQKRWCATCEREVPSAEIVKGFEFEKGRYVVLLDAELDAVAPESSRVIALTSFIDARLLDPWYVARTYFLAPDGALADEAFVLVRDVLRDRDQVGIGTLAIYGREYLVAVRPRQALVLLHTLHHAAELRSMDALEEWARVATATPADPIRLRLARDLVAAQHGPLNLAAFEDTYRSGVQELIDAKIAGQEVVAAPAPRAATLQLMEALTQSLAALQPVKALKAATRGRR